MSHKPISRVYESNHALARETLRHKHVSKQDVKRVAALPKVSQPVSFPPCLPPCLTPYMEYVHGKGSIAPATTSDQRVAIWSSSDNKTCDETLSKHDPSSIVYAAHWKQVARNQYEFILNAHLHDQCVASWTSKRSFDQCEMMWNVPVMHYSIPIPSEYHAHILSWLPHHHIALDANIQLRAIMGIANGTDQSVHTITPDPIVNDVLSLIPQSNSSKQVLYVDVEWTFPTEHPLYVENNRTWHAIGHRVMCVQL